MPPKFTGNVYLSIESNPIAPDLNELRQNSLTYQKKQKSSKSPSSNKLISKSPKERGSSPRRKRQMLKDMLQINQNIR